MSKTDEDENPRAYKKRHNREIDNLFRANGIIASQTAGSTEYSRGYVWNFEWCSEDPAKARPKKVKLVQTMMESGLSFERAFDKVNAGDCWGIDCGEPCTICGAEYGGLCDGGERCEGGVRRCICADGA